MPKNKPSLLPSGFIDILPDQAAYQSKIISKLLRNFELWGYNQVKPPMVEFECSSQDSADVGKYSFRFMDTYSQDMLTVRADMTMQIARMAAIRLKDKPRPLRLSYGGEVLRSSGQGLYSERQLSQTGIEIIGDSSNNCDAEAILLAIDSLKKTGVTDITIDLSMPRMSLDIMEDVEINDDIREKLLDLIEKKDTYGIEILCKENNCCAYEIINRMILMAGPYKRVLNGCSEVRLPQSCTEYCLNLKEIVDIIHQSEPEIMITIDPLERGCFEYHTGVSFALFSKKQKEELGRGGRYKIRSNNEDAVGFTLSVNAIERALPQAPERDKVFVPYQESSAHLRDDGHITVNALEEVDNIYAEAKRLECNFIYDNGEIKSV